MKRVIRVGRPSNERPAVDRSAAADVHEGRRRWRRPSWVVTGGGLRPSGGRRRRVQEPTEQAREVGERVVPALVQGMLGIPLDRVAQDDVVRVERGTVVERDARQRSVHVQVVSSVFGSQTSARAGIAAVPATS